MGSRSRYNAATPEPRGVAMLVPVSVLDAVELVDQALLIELPGLTHIVEYCERDYSFAKVVHYFPIDTYAKISTQLPELE